MTKTPPHGIDLAARSRARRRAVQALYAWHLSRNRMDGIIEQFRREQDMVVADLEYFEDILRGVATHVEELDEGIKPFVDREVSQIDPVELSVLRMGAYELKYRKDVPYRVVINEAVEANKRFGADHGHSYVNGVLDKLARHWRADEKRS